MLGQDLLHLLVILFALTVKFNSVAVEDKIEKVSQKSSTEKKLIKYLIDKYKKIGRFGRPARSSDNQITVYYGLQLIQILDLDENKQILRSNCWPTYNWEDPLLSWTPADYDNLSVVRFYPNDIWTPDIKLYNFADERLVEKRDTRIVLQHNGSIEWLPQALFKSTCAVEIFHFPFDVQDCFLEFGSWTYDITKMNITFYRKHGNKVDFSDYKRSNEWKVEGELVDGSSTEFTSQRDSVSIIRYKNVTDAYNQIKMESYPALRFLLRMKRNYMFFVSILVIPSILLSSLTLVIFWLPPESPAKLMLGINIFLSFFVLLLLLSESTPSAVEDFPMIGGYYCLNMIMITLSTFLATLVMHLYFRGDCKGPVPRFIRRIIIDGFGALVLIRQTVNLMEENKIMKFINNSSSPKHLKRNRMSDIYGKRATQDSVVNDSPILQCSVSSAYTELGIERDVRDIKRCMLMHINKQKMKQRKGMVAMEWRTLALILDRIFFVFYVFAIVIATLTKLPRDYPIFDPPDFSKIH